MTCIEKTTPLQTPPPLLQIPTLPTVSDQCPPHPLAPWTHSPLPQDQTHRRKGDAPARQLAASPNHQQSSQRSIPIIMYMHIDRHTHTADPSHSLGGIYVHNYLLCDVYAYLWDGAVESGDLEVGI